LKSDEDTQTAMIDFEYPEEALYAESRNGKNFLGNTLQVSIGSRTTIFVSNYPATADEAYMRELFGKVNTTSICVKLC
jgi:squamous cell carcinoma antigen recognized by T-cells 3